MARIELALYRLINEIKDKDKEESKIISNNKCVNKPGTKYFRGRTIFSD